jgi:hypothetical protein
MLFHRLLAVSLALLLSNCAMRRVDPVAGQSLKGKQSFFVERHPKEDWNFHQMIADEIAFMGFTASAGEAGQAPAGVDAIVNYDDHWSWDITPWMYMLEISILDARTRNLIISGTSARGSLERRSPTTMAKETLGVIFGTVKPNRKPQVAKKADQRP